MFILLASYREVVQAIVESAQWREALCNTTYDTKGKPTTPLRQLIKDMPGPFLEDVYVEYKASNYSVTKSTLSSALKYPWTNLNCAPGNTYSQ